MNRSAKYVLAMSLTLASQAAGTTRVALAAPEPSTEAPSIPVRELPPLPEVTDQEAKVSSVTVAGAQLAEEDVVVGAAKREQSLGTVASAVTVLTADQLHRFGYRSVAEALSSIVGLYIVDDRMVTRLGIRGVQLLGDANTRILVLVDGTPLNEPWSQSVDLGYALPVHINDVARIEVIRGPVSSLYGTNAFLGIINIITVQADRAAPVHAGVEVSTFGVVDGNVGFATGSVDRQVRGTVSFRRSGGEELEYDAFQDLGTDVVDADGMAALNGSLALHLDELFVQVRGVQRNRELPGAPYDTVIGSTANEQKDRLFVSEAGYTQDLGERFSMAARVYFNNYRLQNPLDYEPPPDFRSEGGAIWYGGELRGLVDVLEDGLLTLTAGVASEWTQTHSEVFFNDVEDESVALERDFNIQGIYSEVTTQPLEWLAATVGARYDRNSLFDNKLSVRGALFITKGEDYGIKFLYAEGFRNPSIFEAYYEDGRRYQPTGTDLRPETITSYEVVAYGRPLRGLKLRVSAWRWNLIELIEKETVVQPVTFDTLLQFQQTGDMRSQGVELESSYRNAAGWFGFLNAALAQVDFIDLEGAVIEGLEVVNAPEIRANLGVSTPAIGPGVHVSTQLEYLSEVETRSIDTGAVGDALVTGSAHLGWHAAVYVPDYRGFDFTLGARNLLGSRRDIPAQVDYDRPESNTKLFVIPGEGRELFLRVGYRYE